MIHYFVLALVNILDESKENCVKTTCSYNGGLYYKRGPLISVSCDASYNIKNVCGKLSLKTILSHII